MSFNIKLSLRGSLYVTGGVWILNFLIFSTDPQKKHIHLKPHFACMLRNISAKSGLIFDEKLLVRGWKTRG